MIAAALVFTTAMAQEWRTPDGGRIMPRKGIPDARGEAHDCRQNRQGGR